MWKKFIGCLMLVGLSLVLYSGCARGPVTTSPLTSPLVTSPVVTPEPEVSPPDVPGFRIDRPLNEGDTEVAGSGPPGVPIVIMDVSYTTVIGEGEVDSDGYFSIDVDPPLKQYSLIGIMLDETKVSPYSKEQIPCGEHCRDQPLVGLLFDYTPVTQSSD